MQSEVLKTLMLGVLLFSAISCQSGASQAEKDSLKKPSTNDVTISQNQGAAPYQGAANEREFLAALINALNSKDLTKRKHPIHPLCLACLEEAKDFYESMFLNEFKREIPQECSQSQIKYLPAGESFPIGGNTQTCSVRLMPISAGEPLMLEDDFSYPVRPTHRLQIEYGDKSKIIQAVQDNGKWFEVIPCPKPETVKKFRQQKNKGRN